MLESIEAMAMPLVDGDVFNLEALKEFWSNLEEMLAMLDHCVACLVYFFAFDIRPLCWTNPQPAAKGYRFLKQQASSVISCFPFLMKGEFALDALVVVDETFTASKPELGGNVPAAAAFCFEQ